MIRLEEQLGFSCDVSEFKSKRNASNTGFSGFVLEMNQCSSNGSARSCECEIGIGGWASTRIREPLVDFVHPFATDAYRTTVRTSDMKDESKTKGFFFLSVFSGQVWIAIATTFVLIAVIYVCDPQLVTQPPERSTLSGEDQSPEPSLSEVEPVGVGDGAAGGNRPAQWQMQRNRMTIFVSRCVHYGARNRSYERLASIGPNFGINEYSSIFFWSLQSGQVYLRHFDTPVGKHVRSTVRIFSATSDCTVSHLMYFLFRVLHHVNMQCY
jgi:hypothetical protein